MKDLKNDTHSHLIILQIEAYVDNPMAVLEISRSSNEEHDCIEANVLTHVLDRFRLLKPEQ